MSDSAVQSKAGAARPALGISAAALTALPACPACYPAYAAVLSGLGLSGLESVGGQTVLTLAFLTVALAALVYRARARRGYGPAILGLIAALVVLAGKYLLVLDALTYLGVGLLVGASIWNVWPRRVADAPACTACANVADASAGT